MLEVPLLELLKDDTGYDRTFKRYPVNFPVVAQTAAEEADAGSADQGKALPGLAHNISLSGIGFVCLGCFDLGSLIEIEITLGSQTYLLLARIRWCRPLDLPGDTLYHYGTQFVRTEASLRFIPAAAEFLLAQGDDRRAGCGPDKGPNPAPAARADLLPR